MGKTSTAPIFVVGSPRSGTTLTARILGRHSRIFTGGENHFFEEIYSRRRELGEPKDPAACRRILERLSTMYGRHNQIEDQKRIEHLLSDPKMQTRFQNCKSYPEILATFMEIQFQHTKKVRWGNNTPKDIFHVGEILSFYPDAKFLLCVRDVRDYLLSYKNQWKSKEPEQLERLKQLYHPIVTSLVWKSTIRCLPKVQAMLPKGNFMIVRYEALVTETEKTVRKVCEVVGEQYEADMLNVDSHNSSHARKDDGIFSTSVDSWRGQLENEEVYLAQRLNKSELESLGYVCDEVPARTTRIAELLLTFPGALRRAMAANASHRGPLLAYLSRRARAIVSG